MNQSLQVYYDGLCHLCSMEIAHYRKCAGADQLEFVDITTPDFSAAKLGLNPQQVNLHLHVRRRDGTLAVGVEAFIAIWEVLPRYRWAARVASLPGVHLMASLGYRAFARIRPLLPRRKSCETSPYCSTTDKP